MTLIKHYIKLIQTSGHLLAISLLFMVSSACAQSNCVFDEKSVTDSGYTSNSEISKFIWDDKTKEVKGILRDGSLFSVKYWACDHYGVHAVMFIGPYSQLDVGNINEQVLKLAKLALNKDELNLIKNYLSKNAIAVESNKGGFPVNADRYSEFYLAYSIVGDILVLEIKLYKD